MTDVGVENDLGSALAATGSPMKAMKAMKAIKTTKVMRTKEGAARNIAKGVSKARPAMAAPSVMKRAMKRIGMKSVSRYLKRIGMKSVSKRSKRQTVIATGIRARAAVFAGRNTRTKGGLTKPMLRKNKRGKIVSKNASDASKRKFAKGLVKWNEAVRKARASLGTIGFVTVNGNTAAGKQIFKKAKQYYVRS
jgi:hypothetical protein